MSQLLHESPHPFAGRRLRVASGAFAGALVEVVDWYDRLNNGRPWTEGWHDPLAHAYFFRSAYARLPMDEEVFVGRMAGRPTLLHVEELVPAQAVELLAWEGAAAAADAIEAEASA